MNIYETLSEVDEMKERSKNNKDDILDHYFKNPAEASLLLLELSKIDKELDDLEKELGKFV